MYFHRALTVVFLHVLRLFSKVVKLNFVTCCLLTSTLSCCLVVRSVLPWSYLKPRLDKFWMNQEIIYDYHAEIQGTGS